jgi:hypothetical protein
MFTFLLDKCQFGKRSFNRCHIRQATAKPTLIAALLVKLDLNLSQSPQSTHSFFVLRELCGRCKNLTELSFSLSISFDYSGHLWPGVPACLKLPI